MPRLCYALLVLMILPSGCDQVRFGAPPRQSVRVDASNVRAILACLEQTDSDNRRDYQRIELLLAGQPINPQPIYAELALKAARFACQG